MKAHSGWEFETWTSRDMPTATVQQWLQGAVAPRPIALASSVNARGEVNLAPFSFYNVFGANPPVLIFSPALRVRDGSSKHTLNNVLEVPEVVVSVVPFALVEQVSLASSEYPEGVNEFHKAGLTPLASLAVRPPRVAECPVHFECKVTEVKALGREGGAGNQVLCEVLHFHVARQVLDSRGGIDPYALDLVGRLGGDWYVRSREGLFEVEKPLRSCGIGVDALPSWLVKEATLSGNFLARLANQAQQPDRETVQAVWLREMPLHGPDPESEAGRRMVLERVLRLLEEGRNTDALALAFGPPAVS